MTVFNVTTVIMAAVAWLLVGVSNADGTSQTNTVLRRREMQEERDLQTTTGVGSVVTKLVLINARTGTAITDLTNGQVISVSGLFGSSAPELSIQAIVSGPVTSLRFGYNENPKFSIEGAAPYAFCGNIGRTFNACRELGLGTYTVAATPTLNGLNGPTVKVMFTVTNNNAPLPVPVKTPVRVPIPVPVSAPAMVQPFTGLRLMYTAAYPNKFITNLEFGVTNVIDLNQLGLPMDTFNIDVLVGTVVKSVQFSNGRSETSKPLAYCGNDGDNFHTCDDDLKLGTTTTISITAYSEPYGQGTAIATRQTTVQIIRSTSPTAPVAVPVKAPVAAPVKSPVAVVPVKAPVAVPVTAPVAPVAPVAGCPIPKMVGEWKRPNKSYPISVAEAQGTMIGNDFLITSGFKNGYDAATPETYAINMFEPNAVWRRMDNMPFPLGLTHLGVAVKGMMAYFCGGYVGGSLGVHNGSCFQYDHSIAPGQGQWTSFATIPDGGRSGGGLIYDSTLDALVYSAGSQRPKKGSKGAIDFRTTWAYSLKNPSAGWVRKADIPFDGNHMNFVTAYDDKGKEHHYFFGGQHGDEEETDNTDEMYEYNAVSDLWMKKASIPNPLGHAAASARAIGCGFVIAGGRTNDGLTDAIMYYDIPTNKWTKIGELTNEIHTNVCVIGNGMLRCETGWATGTFSWTRGITL